MVLVLVLGITLSYAEPSPVLSRRRELQTSDEACTAAPSSATEKYWDIASLSCEECALGLIRSDDGMYCECDRANPVSGCSTCAPPNVTAQDGTACMVCNNAGGATAPTGSETDCTCAGANQILVEYDGAGNRLAEGKACQECPRGRYRSPSSAYECLSCPMKSADATLTAVGVCDCTGVNAGQIAEKAGVYLGECVDDNWLVGSSGVPPAVTSKYNSLKFFEVDNGETSDTEVQVLSYTFKQLFWPSVVRCLQVQDAFETGAGRVQLERTQACQALGNLCVLEDYDIDSSESGICQLFGMAPNEGVFLTTADPIPGRGSEWKQHMPWLFRDDSVRDDSKQVSLKIGFDPNPDEGIVSQLEFKLAKYAV